MRQSRVVSLVAVATLASAGLLRATTITIGGDQRVGPTVQYFGHDAKGSVGLANTTAKAQALYGAGTGANLLRIPMFANAHREDGTTDTTFYSTLLQTINNVKAVNPNVKIFASLKLDGANTFPDWVDGTAIGSIFGNTVFKPNAGKYSDLIVDYVQYMQSNGVKIDYFGAGNETEFALTADRYVDTVRQVKTKLVSSGVPETFRSFQYVAGEAYSIVDSNNYLQDIIDTGGMDTVDLAGSHGYPSTPSHSKQQWINYVNRVDPVPVWHTELHMNPANANNGSPDSANIYRMRAGMANAFAVNIAGATGFTWWSGSNSTTALDKVLKNQILTSMVGAAPLSTSPGYSSQDLDETAPLYQAYRKGDTITLWVANPGSLDALPQIDLDNTKISGVVSGLYYFGPGNTVQSGVLSITPDADARGFSVTNFPFNSIARITFNVLAESDNRWDVNADGNWGTAANWTTGVPNAVSETATFGSIISTPRTVTLAANTTVATLSFDNTNTYTLVGTKTLTLDASGGGNTVNVLRGLHVINAALTTNDATTFNVSAGATLRLGGTLTANTNAWTKTGTGTMMFDSVVTTLDGPLNVSAGNAVFNSSRTNIVSIAAGASMRLSRKATDHQAGSASRVKSLTLAGGLGAPTARLELANNDLLLDYDAATPITMDDVRVALRSGYNGGAWTGNGIALDAAAPAGRAIAYLSAAQYLAAKGNYAFDNLTGDATSIYLRYTRQGDTNLDDNVDFNDLLALAQNYGDIGLDWARGDFNYDANVDFDDLLMLAQSYGSPAAFDADWAMAQSLVPEPMLGSLLLLGLPAAIRRRG